MAAGSPGKAVPARLVAAPDPRLWPVAPGPVAGVAGSSTLAVVALYAELAFCVAAVATEDLSTSEDLSFPCIPENLAV